MATVSKKNLDLAAALVAEYGLSIDLKDAVENAESNSNAETIRKTETRNAIETVLRTLHHRHSTQYKVCAHCGGAFQSTYCYRRFCSDDCSVAAFQQKFGIHPSKLTTPESFWQYEPDAAIPAWMTKGLYEWAKHVIKQIESLEEDQRDSLPDLDEETSDIWTVQVEPDTLPQYQVSEDLAPQANPLLPPDKQDLPEFDFEL